MANTDAQPLQFWSWFEQHAARLRELHRSERTDRVVAEVDAKMHRLLPGLNWEIGPSADGDDVLFFALSASASREVLEATRRYVQDAPELAGWKILPAKPAKQWHRRRARLTSNAGTRWVEFDAWTFSASTTRDGLLVMFVPRDVDDFAESELEWLAWMFLDWELGEEFVLDHVGDVLALSALDTPVSASELGDALRSLVSPEP